MKRQTILLVLALVLILVVTTPAAYEEEGMGYEILSIRENMYLSNVAHAPIEIFNDSQFVNQATAESWAGDGSEFSPYLIEAYDIYSDFPGIHIQNVSLYFQIKACDIDSVSGIFNPGILFWNVSHCEILDTTVYGKTFGIYVDFHSNVLVSGCTISGCSVYGVFFQNADGGRVENSEIFWNERGIDVQSTNSVEIFNTDVHDNREEGIYLINSDFCTITEGSSYDNSGAGMFIYDSQNCTIELNEVYGNQDIATGIHLLISNNATISGNEVYDNLHVGIFLDQSNFPIIHNNDVWNNTDVGIHISGAVNCTVTNNDVWENGFQQIYFLPGGISFDSVMASRIEGNRVWNNTFAGIALVEISDNNDVVGNMIWNNTDHGIFADDSYWIDVLDNEIWGNGWNYSGPPCGIFAANCQFWSIQNNKIWNNTMDGISFLSGGYSLIENNEIHGNTGNGVSLALGGSGDFVVDDNLIHHNNEYGIYVQLDWQANITNNIVYDNSIGVVIEASPPSWIYGNDIGWNLDENAADVTGVGNNNWHDNVSIGNHWSDYSGVGDYVITAFVMAGAYDIFPEKSLDLNASLPLAFEITETGNTMLWGAYALNPSHYEVYADDTLLYSEEWDGDNIEADLDGLAAGDFVIRVIAYHISGHSTNETATAEVTDLTAPEWTMSVQDQEITEGDSFSYQLSAEDPSGIGGFSVNDTLFMIDSSGLITTEIVLLVGEYNLNVTVWDTFGNSRSVLFTVTVLPAPPTGDGTTMLLLAAGGGVVVLLVAVIIIMKKRQ